MFWKLILTAAVILGAVLVIRARMQRLREVPVPESQQRALVPRGLARGIAYALVGLSLGGAAFYLVHSWNAGRQVLLVQVLNANTGLMAEYKARRRDIEARGFRTLEGQVIRLADVERMILTPADRARPPGSERSD
jgi:hypothetical protein